jgi:site-specific DNA recombinase
MLKYAIYARKSHDDRKVTEKSINEQVGECRLLQTQHGLSVERKWEESRTARIPDNRPLWAELVREVRAGRIDAILCWHINRLVRNMKEGGELVQLFVDGKIKEIRTPHGLYRAGDNILSLVIEAANAAQFSIDLQHTARRSMGAKAADGGHNGFVAPGYLNARHPMNSKRGTIVKDPDRFDQMRRAWELLLTGGSPVRAVAATLNDSWGYRTRETPKRPTRRLSENTLYQAFRNPFYAGFVRHEGRLVRGQHEPMVTADEFERAQAILVGRSFKAARTAAHPFTGLMACSRCGQQVTAEQKRLRNGTLWETYHCSNSFRTCTSRGMSFAKVQLRVVEELEAVRIDPEAAQIALDEILAALNAGDASVVCLLASQEEALAASKSRLDRLADLWLGGLLTDRTRYAELERREVEAMNDLVLGAEKTRNELERMKENARRAHRYVAFARREFARALPDRKRAISRALGTRWLFDGKDKWIRVEPDPLLLEFVAFSRSGKGPLEPRINGFQKPKQAPREEALVNGGRLTNSNEPETTGSEAAKAKRIPGSLVEALKGPLFPDLGLGIEPEA